MTTQYHAPPQAALGSGYGIDAPYVPLGLGLAATVLVVLAVASARTGSSAADVAVTAAGAGWFAALTGVYLHTTRRGKFTCWEREITALDLAGTESVLDVGCGRGAVLAIIASRIPGGRPVGIDLWRSKDQSGNDVKVARTNVGGAGRAPVELHTADMAELPFADRSFDVVVSSAAVHNLEAADRRERAVEEMARVLRPGGHLLIADFRHVGQYEGVMKRLGWHDVVSRNLGWRFWYSGPWLATRMLAATKPRQG